MNTPVFAGRAMLVLAGLFAAAGTQAASFDCQAAQTDVEHAICADDGLGRMDESLGRAYEAAREEMPVTGRAGLQGGQREWLRERDSCIGEDRDDARGCLRETMQARIRTLDSRLIDIRSAFDRIVASIPSDPAGTAKKLRGYDSRLAQAWLLYLWGDEPRSGVSEALARDLRGRSRARLREADDFAASILDDIAASDEAAGDLTLLRMWIERFYDDERRPYVHCFVFHRQPALAYRTMGSLYGSTRDASAPVCAPEGGLFESVEWKRLQAAFKPVVVATHGPDFGTIRFADFAEWRIRDLQLTVTPLDYLDPLLDEAYRVAPEQAIEDWANDEVWPQAGRDAARTALAQARTITVAWLQAQRGLPPGKAAKVAEAFLQVWVGRRVVSPN